MFSNLITATVALLAILVVPWTWTAKKPFPTLPRPFQLPILGSMLAYFPKLAQGHLPQYLAKLQDRLGPILAADLFGSFFVVVSDAAAGRRILTSSDFTRSDYLLKNSTDLFEFPLFGMKTGDIWKKHRKAVQSAMGPQFVQKAFTAAVGIMDDLVRIFNQRIETAESSDTTVDIREYISYSTLDIIMLSAFSHNMSCLDTFENSELAKTSATGSTAATADTSTLRTNIDRFSQSLVYRIVVPPLLHWFFNATPKQLVPVNKFFDDMVNSFLLPRKNGLVQEDGDFLEVLLAKDENGESIFTDAEIKDETLSILLAGHETTSNALTNVFLVLAQRPEILSKLKSEIDTLLPHPDSDLSFDQLPKFKYLDNLLRETLRYYPVVFAIDRIGQTQVKLMGHEFEKDSVFTVHVQNVHFDVNIWGEDAKEFIPERFDRGSFDAGWMPFGAGPHMCPGMKMAMMEKKVVLIKLFHQFNFDLVPGQNLVHVHGVAMHLPKGLKLRVTRRNRADLQ
ncbi:cytochrome P450 [Obelidium mucronatum]|nr:cytochrome P450 [Obelidium mucronatum]